MRKIVRQQNYLKDLIETQGNHFLTRQSLKCFVRSSLEPLLDNPENGVVLYRIENKEGLQGLLKRLEFSAIESINYADDSDNLIEKVWANTEFLCVLTHRYVSIIVWDTNTGDKDSVRYYSIVNSKLQNEALDIIKRNSKIDISEYQTKYTPDRRDNVLLNASVHKLLDNMEESASDAVLGYAEQSAETLINSDYMSQKSRIIAHEVRNQLSICDLYSEIIRKHIEKEIADKESILNALNTINKSIKMANNSLISLKTKENAELKPYLLQEIVNETIELGKVYLEEQNIDLQVENTSDIKVLADSEKLIAVLINLIKNASEAFHTDVYNENTPKNGKYIKIKTEKDNDFVVIMVSNNAPEIKEPEKIFNQGFSTKSNGTGLGLWICKKSIEEQLGQIELSRSGEDYTEFTIRLKGVD
ncbi:MAG: HAMP domain-containing histidine kinase [bacterium]|nr:HAMP domain-containing histidine kinase [bacterium]